MNPKHKSLIIGLIEKDILWCQRYVDTMERQASIGLEIGGTDVPETKERIMFLKEALQEFQK